MPQETVPQSQSAIAHHFTVDVEEYFQVSALEPFVPRDSWDAIPGRLNVGLRPILDLMAETGAKGTFFVLGWIAKRYWRLVGSNYWSFAVDTGERTKNGKPIVVRLALATDTKIRRHIKIRSDANPFDPRWASYFEERAFLKARGRSP